MMRATFVLFSLLSLNVGVSGCASLSEILGYGFTQPEVTLVGVEVKNFDYGQIKLDVRLLVKNPNDFDIKLTRLDYNVLIAESLLAKGQMEQMFVVPASGKNEVRLPLVVSADAAMKLIAKMLEKKKEDVLATINANAEFDSPVGRIEKSFTGQQSIKKMPL